MIRTRTKTRRRPLLELAIAAGMSLLISLPIALFFMVQQGGGARMFRQIYLVTLVLAGSVNLVLWLAQTFLVPRLKRPDEPDGPAAAMRGAGVLGGAAAIGTLLGGLIVRATLIPTFLGSSREVVLFAVYFLLFLGVSLAVTLGSRLFQRMEGRVRADQELRLARRIQSAYLPTEFATPPSWDLHAVNVASRQVSGDIYDVISDGRGTLLLAVADVAGKGVPAAMLSSMLQASLRTQADDPGVTVPAMLGTLNRLLLQQHAQEGRFATLFLARLDQTSGRLRYSNAGHCFPLLRRADGTIETLEVGGLPVGVVPDVEWEEGAVVLGQGDLLVLYTDGISEASVKEREFGVERLPQLVRELPPELECREVAVRILNEVNRFTGGLEPEDDRTLMVVRMTSTPRPDAPQVNGRALTQAAPAPQRTEGPA